MSRNKLSFGKLRDSSLSIRCLRLLFVILVLTAATGGQWAVLQSAAWVGMLVNNLRTRSLAESMERTFDGKHPCPLCKAIENGRKSEKKSEAEVKSNRIEFPPIDQQSRLAAGEYLQPASAWSDEFADSLPGSCLLQPPRAALA